MLVYTILSTIIDNEEKQNGEQELLTNITKRSQRYHQGWIKFNNTLIKIKKTHLDPINNFCQWCYTFVTDGNEV